MSEINQKHAGLQYVSGCKSFQELLLVSFCITGPKLSAYLYGFFVISILEYKMFTLDNLSAVKEKSNNFLKIKHKNKRYPLSGLDKVCDHLIQAGFQDCICILCIYYMEKLVIL